MDQQIQLLTGQARCVDGVCVFCCRVCFFFNSRPRKVIVPWEENELLSVMEGYVVWLAGMHVLRIPRKVLLVAASRGKCQLLLSAPWTIEVY